MSTFFARLVSYWVIMLTILVCIPLIGHNTTSLSYVQSREKLQVALPPTAFLLLNPFSAQSLAPPTPAPLIVPKEEQSKVPPASVPKRTDSVAVQKKNRSNSPTVTALPASVNSTQERVVTANCKSPKQYVQKFRGNISAYTNGLSETGKTSRHPDYGITASGHRTKAGVTVAAGRHIPYGTVLYIEGIGYRTVHDRGGAIKGNKIDVFMSNMKQVNAFGRRHLDVYIVKWGDGKRKHR
ncbi:3D domain-containing protein [Aneurinibacillus soli]|uniref:Cell wall-binding protein YocH n=1 Tax=Aneurinibacillus soli TaxID=1500254 RepID=A0A0U5BD06_9BACL|nr:3D domain-containing protein [Aneurinibacillus soli]PYE62191.1 3D domain-containing protein [Aneurinibacillus soli]BAU28621.1 Cell wall-binding protein YocH precursor [Aneurinibacillus soli]